MDTEGKSPRYMLGEVSPEKTQGKSWKPKGQSESISKCLCHFGCTHLHTHTHPVLLQRKRQEPMITNEENKQKTFLFESKLKKWELAPHLNQGA